MPLVIRNRRSPTARWLRRFFLAMGIALLGYVVLSLADAALFQTYENWQLDRALKQTHALRPTRELQTVDASLASGEKLQDGPVALGGMLGRIDIRSVGIAVIIVEGSDGKALRRGVGHLVGTPLPGEPGNVVLTGHRDTFFRPLRNIQRDDEVTLTTLKGTYRYRVDLTEVIGAEANEVLNDSEGSILTLVTCYPFYFVGPAPKRFIVRAHKI
jgi:sortase A